MWLIWAGLAAGLVALPAIREIVRKPVALRQGRPEGTLARLRAGLTHIRIAGPSKGAPIVLVHGLTTPSFVFDGMIEDLVARGHRVISYDHYGRGLSDRPRIAQDAEMFRSHLAEVLDFCELRGPVTLLGYSMGGAVVAAFAAHAPRRVSRLILVAPAGLHAPLRGVSQRLLRVPLVGNWLFLMVYPRRLCAGIEAERTLPGAVPGMADRQLDETRYRGFFPAVLRSLRGILAAPMVEDHARIARAGLPVTAIFAEHDPLVPMRAADTLVEGNPSAGIVVIKGAGHGLIYTHAPEVLAAI